MDQTPRGISNVSIRSRVKQFIILIVAIFIGVIISQTVKAQSGPPRYRHAKHQIRIPKSEKKACEILAKKREQPHNQTVVASRKPRFRPMAEVDAPGTKRNPQVAGL